MEWKYLFDEIVRLGYKCNEKCLFCNFTPVNEPWYKEKTFEDVKEELDGLIKKYNGADNLAIYFSGGEPLLRGEALFKMIDYARQSGIGKIGLQSNATLITKKHALRLKELWIGNVLVSLHSHLDSINDQITLHKNSSTLGVKGIKNLLDAGVSFTINHVLNKINYTHFSEYLLFLKSIGVTKLSLGVVQPHWYAEENFDDIVVNYDDLYKYLKEGYKVAQENGILLIGHYCDIPLCKFEEKIIDDLNYKSLLEVREKGVRNYKGFVDELTGSKMKTKNCKLCKYNNYCYGVWRNYVRGFWEDSIWPKHKYVSLLSYISEDKNVSSQESVYQIEKTNIGFIHTPKFSTWSIKKALKKWNLVIQYYITWTDFCSEGSDFCIDIVSSGVTSINLDLSDTQSLNVSVLFKTLHEIMKFSRKNTPYYNVVFFIKCDNKNLKQLLKRTFKDTCIFVGSET